jgi:hypothetical protein
MAAIPPRSVLLAALAGSALGTGPALAQGIGACGQPLALTEVVAGFLSGEFEPVRRFLEVRRSEPRYLEFSLDAPSDVTLRTESTGGDPTLTLYDQNGRMRTWDDDSGGDLQALISESLPAGTYCAQLRPAGSSPVEFEVTVVVLEPGLRTAPGTAGPCSDPAAVRDLALNLSSPVAPVTFDGVTDGETGLGDFRITLSEMLSLRIDAASSELDTYLTVLDAAGNIMGENDDFEGLNSRVDVTLPAGEYCVSVRDFGYSSGPFTVALAESDGTDTPMPTTSGQMPCGDPAEVTLLSNAFGPGSEPITQSWAVDPDRLLSEFSVIVTNGVAVRIDAQSGFFDTILDLHDMSGGFIAGNDDGPDGGTDSRIDATLAAGEYCVTVRGFGDSYGPFDLMLAVAGGEVTPGTLDPALATGIEDMGTLETELRSYTITSEPTLWTSFTLDGEASVRIEGISVTSAFAVALLAEDGTELAVSDPADPMSAATLGVTLPAGTYFVALTNFGASGTILRQITVTRE